MHTLTINQWELLERQLAWATDGPVLPVNRNSAFGLGTLQAAWYIRKGSAEITQGQTTVRAVAGQWLFPAMNSGWQSLSDDASIISIRFLVTWPTGQALFTHDNPLVIAGVAIPALLRAATRLASLTKLPGGRGPDQFSRMKVELTDYLRLRTLFENWLKAYSEAMSIAGLKPNLLTILDERVLAALRKIQSAPLTEPFRESALARSLGLSVSQLNRLFARDLGQSPRHFHEERRLQVARFELSESQLPIKAVAHALGFNHAGHFTNWFRKSTGVSPSAYRLESSSGSV